MDKKTVAQDSPELIPEIQVNIINGILLKSQPEYSDSFTIGRDETCDIQFDEEIISRFHARVQLENGKWFVEDSGSTNGTYLKSQKISRVELQHDMQIEFGKNGPVIKFGFPQTESSPQESLSVTHYVDHYFDEKKDDTDAGAHTRVLRQAFERVQKKKISKYYIIIGVAVVLLLIAGGYSIYQHIEANEQKLLAEEIFYNMKSLELQMAQLQASLDQSADESASNDMKRYNDSRADMEANYDKFVNEIGFYSDKDETERLILKMARMFGECEINAPKEFISEVEVYIRNWQSTKRYNRAIQRARDQGFPKIIISNMLRKFDKCVG
jgi:membrane-bound lytic murein transglycosylase D